MRSPFYRIIFVFCLLFALLVTSCKTKHKVVYSTTPVEEKANSELFNDVVSSSLSYTTFSSRLNLNITSGTKTLSSKATLRIVRDSAIQISVQPLFGVEMFRFYIDPHKFVLLDRMNKRYVEETISSLKEQYPIGFDYYTMQSMLTNAPFVAGKDRVETSDYRSFNYTQTSDLNYYLLAKDPESGIEYSFTVNGDDRITFTHLLQSQNQQSLQWAYDEFAVIAEFIFPQRMLATISTKSRKFNSEFQFSGIVINEPITISMTVPNGYNRVTISDVLKIIAPDK